MGIDDDAEEGAAAVVAVAVGEEAIVGEYGADAGEDGVGVMAERLDVEAGLFGGDPAGVVVGGGDFAVECEGAFEGDEGAAFAHEEAEGFVELLGGGGEAGVDEDFDTGGAEFGEALAGDAGVGVLQGGDDAGDSGGDEGVGARRCASGVGAGFECDVEGGAAGFGPGLGEGDGFGVEGMGVDVMAAAEDEAVFDDDGSDGGVRGGAAEAETRLFERQFEAIHDVNRRERRYRFRR